MYYCNPLNIEYRYQFMKKEQGYLVNREAADPSLILFHDKYYLFPSMTKGFLVSNDLVHWEMKPLVGLPVYDYAPDVRVMGDYMYFSASHRDTPCNFYRTQDPEIEKFECIPGTFEFWDPNLFIDDDGRCYFYWGCSSVAPIYGVELNPLTMHQISDVQELIFEHRIENGYERIGEDHSCIKKRNYQFEEKMRRAVAQHIGKKLEELPKDLVDCLELMPPEVATMIRNMLFDDAPNVEGAWMTKYQGKYYLQYAGAGTEYNTYGDGTYVGLSPLGPFSLARNNPYSYHPGGFCPGAGHGSTLQDQDGQWWHPATMRICVNHNFERRIGLWPAGFDDEGELYCNQRYGDWPVNMEKIKENPWTEPDLMILSYGKRVSVSSGRDTAGYAVDENVQTSWRAEKTDENPYLMLDLGEVAQVQGIQVNFGDDVQKDKLPRQEEEWVNDRYIDDVLEPVQWLLESSMDGQEWKVLVDKTQAETSLCHDYIALNQEIEARYIRLSKIKLTYGQQANVSGLRIFGHMNVSLPQAAQIEKATRVNDTDMDIKWNGNGMGYEVLWGYEPNRLYHSYRVFGQTELTIKALVASQKEYFVRVDSFNEAGIVHGQALKVIF